MSHSMSSPDLGYGTDSEIIERLIPSLQNLHLIDVGCGSGSLARQLAAKGATVLGLEPDPIQAASNQSADPIRGVTLEQGSAERIPSADHVPAELMDLALREAARVLKRETGFLYILEPDMRGAFSQLIKPFHDETLVRQQALAALTRTADPIFKQVDEYWYTTVSQFDNFESFADQMRGHTFNNYGDQIIDSAEVKANFAAGWQGHCYQFNNLMRVRYYQQLIEA